MDVNKTIKVLEKIYRNKSKVIDQVGINELNFIYITNCTSEICDDYVTVFEKTIR